MKYEEIIKLLDAGYSRDEIMQMDADPAAEPAASAADPAAPAADPAASAADPAADISSVVGELKDVFEDFKKEIIAMNIMNSKIDKPDETGTDVIAKIINPFTREKE